MLVPACAVHILGNWLIDTENGRNLISQVKQLITKPQIERSLMTYRRSFRTRQQVIRDTQQAKKMTYTARNGGEIKAGDVGAW